MTKFERSARRVAKELGYEGDDFHFADNTRKNDDAYEDDGTLHIEKRGEWCYFHIGQDYPARVWNEKVTEILTAMGLAKMIGPRCLQEPDEEDDECPHCGGRLQ
jgi:hypothetical protein